MRQYYYSTTILIKDKYKVNIVIQYWFEPYSPGYFDPGYGGEPPSGPDIGIKYIYVKWIEQPSLIGRAWLKDRGWLKVVENLVLDQLSDNLNVDGILWEKMVHNAEAEYEDL
jgi:hypothetical protein